MYVNQLTNLFASFYGRSQPSCVTPFTPLTPPLVSRPLALRYTFARRPWIPWRRRSSTGTVCSQDRHASVSEGKVSRRTESKSSCSAGRTRDGLPVDQARKTRRRDVLTTFHQIGLNHNAQYHLGSVAGFQLLRLENEVSVTACEVDKTRRLTISSATSICFLCCFELLPCEQSTWAGREHEQYSDGQRSIHHDLRLESSLDKFLSTITNELSLVVRSGSPSSKDDMDVGVSLHERIVQYNSMNHENDAHTSVSTILLNPPLPTLKNTCGRLAALQASIAIPTVPSVEFLNPVGIDNADVNSLCT